MRWFSATKKPRFSLGAVSEKDGSAGMWEHLDGWYIQSQLLPSYTDLFLHQQIHQGCDLSALEGTGRKHYTKQHRPPNFSFTPFKRRGELIWSWQSNLTAKISTSFFNLLFQCSEGVPVPPAYLSACVITLVTLEALLILVRLLMLYEGIAFMKHSITIATLLALFNVGMLLSQMNT